MTIQASMKKTMESAKIPYKEIQVFGSQIIVTVGSIETANKWVSFLSRFATVRKVVESRDYNQIPGTHVCNSMHRVWRVGAFID